MLSYKEIKKITLDLLEKEKLKITIKFPTHQEFAKVAKKSPIISQVLKEGNTLDELKIPALFDHKRNTVYFDLRTIIRLLKGEPYSIEKRFIQAIVHHEICHIHNKHKLKDHSFNNMLLSEERAKREFRRYYPGLAALGKRITSKTI